MMCMVPIRLTHSRLLSCSLAEDSTATEWNIAASYDTGDAVYKDEAGGHRIFRSAIDSNVGNDPDTDDGTNWVEDDWTNRWKCLKFDTGAATLAPDSSDIEYEIELIQPCSEIIFRGLRSSAVTIDVYNASAVLVHTATKGAEETIGGYDWYIGDLIFTDVPADEGYTVTVTVASPSGSDVAAVGQMAFGVSIELGLTVAGIELGINDFAKKDQDQYGKFSIVERGVSDTLDADILHDTHLNWLVQMIFQESKDAACAFWLSEALVDAGVLLIGYADEPVTTPGRIKSESSLDLVGIVYESYGLVTP